jgi:dihydroorotate dehydrogenase
MMTTTVDDSAREATVDDATTIGPSGPRPLVLRGIPFARVWNASGARGFFGEGYSFHRAWKPFGLDFAGATFVAKTTTVEPRSGNMPLDARHRPRHFLPSCIKVNLRAAAVLNAVGLSGPGAEALLASGCWQSRLDPFLLSFMAVDADPSKRLGKASEFAARIASHRSRFRAPFGIQLNFSCPNVGLNPDKLIMEACDTLRAISKALPGIPLVPKFNALVPTRAAREVATHPACDAIAISNTIPWGTLPDRIDWKSLFGEVSPLAHIGGGGLSGKPLLPVVWDWLDEAKRLKFPAPIVAGGGILSASDAGYLFSAGPSAIELGSVTILRPWRVRGIVRSISQAKGNRPCK